MICPYFYFYHDLLICQCSQESSNCMAILSLCENKMDRLCYLADLKEEEKC